jgi:hypothetical protein
VKQTFATVGERRRFWEKFFVNDRLAQSLANQDTKAVEETTEQLLRNRWIIAAKWCWWAQAPAMRAADAERAAADPAGGYRGLRPSGLR